MRQMENRKIIDLNLIVIITINANKSRDCQMGYRSKV
jgi:hypothetical protein